MCNNAVEKTKLEKTANRKSLELNLKGHPKEISPSQSEILHYWRKRTINDE